MQNTSGSATSDRYRFYMPCAKDASRLARFFTMRPCRACESGWLDFFIWAEYYRVRYTVMDDRALLIVMKSGDEYFAALPYCTEEDLPHYFGVLRDFFNDVLEQPFKIYLADEEGVNALKLAENDDYVVREEPDFRDYIYDAEAMRTLAGRKLQKKRNLINHFLQEYEGRWEYRTLVCEDRDTVIRFLDEWFPNEKTADEEAEETLCYEREGLMSVLTDCEEMDLHAGGIFIDGELKAFTLGTYNPREEMAIVSVEKADPDIPGLYQLINREFITHAFPGAKLVNREDDMGLPGLRHAKESYKPVAYEKKYMVVQKCFRGRRVDTTDPYEESIAGREMEEA